MYFDPSWLPEILEDCIKIALENNGSYALQRKNYEIIKSQEYLQRNTQFIPKLNLIQLDLDTAESDGELKSIASVVSIQDNMIRDSELYSEERELIVEKMNLEELLEQIVNDDDYFEKNESEAYRNFIKILSLTNLRDAQFYDDYILDEEDFENFDMRFDLDMFEGMIQLESDKNYGDDIIIALKELIEDYPEKFKDT